MRGPAGYLSIIGMMRGGFPDIQWTLEELVAEGDKVVVQAMNIYRLVGSKFVEEYGQPDMLVLGLLQQIGVIPSL